MKTVALVVCYQGCLRFSARSFYFLTIYKPLSNISSIIRLYADDVILYEKINSEDDVLLLQEDLSIIAH